MGNTKHFLITGYLRPGLTISKGELLTAFRGTYACIEVDPEGYLSVGHLSEGHMIARIVKPVAPPWTIAAVHSSSMSACEGIETIAPTFSEMTVCWMDEEEWIHAPGIHFQFWRDGQLKFASGGSVADLPAEGPQKQEAAVNGAKRFRAAMKLVSPETTSAQAVGEQLKGSIAAAGLSLELAEIEALPDDVREL
jgi:hypothetical protein